MCRIRLLQLFLMGFSYLFSTVSALAPLFSYQRSKNHLFGSRTDSDDFPDVKRTYMATCIPGLAPILEQELEDLGIADTDVTSPSAVFFTATPRQALETLLWARTPHRIMELLCSTTGSNSQYEQPITDRQSLYDFCYQHVDVKDLLGDGRGDLLSLSVSTVLNQVSNIPKDINHSHYSALTIKNALVDKVRELRGDRPDVNLENPDVPLVAVLKGQHGTAADVSLFRQLHIGSLHRRGYRTGAVHKAALKESLASALLLHAEWPTRTSTSLIDPMAGSGTLLIEAASIAADVAPGLMRLRGGLPHQRHPPVLRWKHDHDLQQTWKELVLEATERCKAGLRQCQDQGVTLLGNEIHAGALGLLEDAVDGAGLSSLIRNIRLGDCRDYAPQAKEPWTVVCNPPWGVRLDEDMVESWESLRIFLRETCPPGTKVWVLSGNSKATKHLGLRRSSSLAIKTGDQDLRWLEYEIVDKSDVNRDYLKRLRNKEGKNGINRAIKPVKRRRNKVEPRVTVPDEENEWLLD